LLRDKARRFKQSIGVFECEERRMTLSTCTYRTILKTTKKVKILHA